MLYLDKPYVIILSSSVQLEDVFIGLQMGRGTDLNCNNWEQWYRKIIEYKICSLI